jgi:hypothetical protein
MPAEPHASWPTCQLAHMPAEPHANWPTCQLSHMPTGPHANWPTCQLAHMPTVNWPTCQPAHMHHLARVLPTAQKHPNTTPRTNTLAAATRIRSFAKASKGSIPSRSINTASTLKGCWQRCRSLQDTAYTPTPCNSPCACRHHCCHCCHCCQMRPSKSS